MANEYERQRSLFPRWDEKALFAIADANVPVVSKWADRVLGNRAARYQAEEHYFREEFEASGHYLRDPWQRDPRDLDVPVRDLAELRAAGQRDLEALHQQRTLPGLDLGPGHER